MPISVSLGVCAYNEAGRIGSLLESLREQSVPPRFRVDEILIVASGCTDGTESEVEAFAVTDPRIRLIRESERRGKASAINRILSVQQGAILVLVNADARLGRGALAALLEGLERSPDAWLACGAPVPEAASGLSRALEEVQWDLHNRTLEVQSARRQDNHCCDELMALRRGFVESLPPDLINDGAYLGVLAALSGRSVLFCPDARVYVRAPRSVRGFVEQRRRILRGHRQIRRKLQRSPTTLERLSTRDPALAARILVRHLMDHPWNLVVLFLVAIPLEGASALLAAADEVRSPGYSPIWTKVDSL